PAPGGQKQMPAFSLPPGFVIERVAGPPLVERPMMAGFDERGRLFVCDSFGFNLMHGTSEIFVKNPRDVIRLPFLREKATVPGYIGVGLLRVGDRLLALRSPSTLRSSRAAKRPQESPTPVLGKLGAVGMWSACCTSTG